MERLAPIIADSSVETEALIKETAVEEEKALLVKMRVSADEAVVNRQAGETEAAAYDCQRDLDEALPALRAAEQALSKLKKADISEMKAMANPPEKVKTVMETVCLLFEIKKPGWNDSKVGEASFGFRFATWLAAQ
jgi:dynein heavy chain